MTDYIVATRSELNIMDIADTLGIDPIDLNPRFFDKDAPTVKGINQAVKEVKKVPYYKQILYILDLDNEDDIILLRLAGNLDSYICHIEYGVVNGVMKTELSKLNALTVKCDKISENKNILSNKWNLSIHFLDYFMDMPIESYPTSNELTHLKSNISEAQIDYDFYKSTIEPELTKLNDDIKAAKVKTKKVICEHIKNIATWSESEAPTRKRKAA